MGKSKNKRFRLKKAQPTGLQSMKEAQEEDEELANASPAADVQQKTIGVLEKLQSASAEERECACRTLANLVQDQKALETLVKQRAVRSLGPLLLDPSAGIREAAAGALRNLTVVGGDAICDLMVDEDVMTTLVAFLLQYSDGIPQPPPAKQKDKLPQHDSSLEALIQAVHLVWNLCESSSTAVAVANQHGLMAIFLQCLQAHQTLISLAIAAAQCLHTFTEDNLLAAQELCKPDRLAILEGALLCGNATMQHVQLQTLTAGILFNIRGSLPATSRGQSFQALVKVLAATLEPDTCTAVSSLVPGILTNGNVQNGSVSAEQEDKEEHKTLPWKLESDLAEAEALLQAQQVALEIISNMCCPEDDDDDWEDMESNSTSSSSSSSDDAQENTTDEVPQPIMSPLCLSAEIHSALADQCIPTKILEKINFPDRDLLRKLISHKEGKPLFKGLLRVQSRALLCLHNMVAAMELDSLGGVGALSMLLDRLLALAMSEPVPVGSELIEALTSALRAVLQKMAQNNCVPEALTEVHLTRLCSLGQESGGGGDAGPSTSGAGAAAAAAAGTGGQAGHRVRANLVGVLGSIGSVLAKRDGTEPLLMAVGGQLLEVATKDSSLWVAAEALDAIFDTFGDGVSADRVAIELGLTARLKAMVPQLKAKLRQNRGSLGEHLPVILNARTNLGRFIKYKENQELVLGTFPPT